MNQYISKALYSILLVFLLTINPNLASAQERVDGKSSYKITRVSQLMTNITGWAYDKSNLKWAGYKNCIEPEYKRGNNKIPLQQSPRDMSHLYNVISIRIRDVVFQDSTYHVLTWALYEGGWEYPTLKLDWSYGKAVNVFLFKKENMKNS